MKRYRFEILGENSKIIKGSVPDNHGEWVKYHDAVEYATQQYSIGMYQGMIEMLNSTLSFIKGCSEGMTPSDEIYRYCKNELNRFKKMNPIEDE